MISTYFIGRLGADCKVNTLQSGKTVINFSVAVDTGYGENKKTLWCDCSYYTDKTAIVPYLTKSVQVFIEGEPSIRTWETNGKTGAAFTVRVQNVKLLGGKQESAAPQTAQNTYPSPQAIQPEEKDDLPF